MEEQLISAAAPRRPLQQVAPAQHNSLLSPPVYPAAGEVTALTAQYGELRRASLCQPLLFYLS